MAKSLTKPRVVAITSKGQATIPAELRKRLGFGKRVLVEEASGGVLFKPLPSVEDERGSLCRLFAGTSARQLIEEARRADFERRALLER